MFSPLVYCVSMPRHASRILACAAGHFVVAMLIAAIAFGTDMDQLRSRSPWSRGAGVIHDVLWYPHDAAMRAIPNDWLVRHRVVIPLAIVMNSLCWGILLHTAWLARRSRA